MAGEDDTYDDAEMMQADLQKRLNELTRKDLELRSIVGDDDVADVYHYIKLTIRETRDDHPKTKPAVSGLQLVNIDGSLAEFSDAWCNTWSSSTRPQNIIDNNPKTAWKDEKLRPVILKLTDPAALLGYRMLTCCDNPDADPKFWALEGAQEVDGPWTLLHEVLEEGVVPRDRSNWSILIPISNSSADKALVKTIMKGDELKQAIRLSNYDKMMALRVQKEGPSRSEVSGMLKVSNRKREELNHAGLTEAQKRKRLQAYRSEIDAAEKKQNVFCKILLRKVNDLMELAVGSKSKAEISSTIELPQALRTIQDVEDERECTLVELYSDLEKNKYSDNGLTATLTRLQARCGVEIPQIRDEAEKTKRQIYLSSQKEIRLYEEEYRTLDVKSRELNFHTKRGTNFKDSKKRAAVSKTNHLESWDSGFDTGPGVVSTCDDHHAEVQRLKRVKVQIGGQRKSLKAETEEELGKLRKLAHETYQERSHLGQERCELQQICADFTALIERLQEQLDPSTQQKIAPALTTSNLTYIGHVGPSRASPRASPRRSPSRSYNKSPRSTSRLTARTPRTPREVNL
eukprot:TRINITY_DN24664_c0_g1_i1.p1 TRINITY_DN24664_c0_g1~~TRINITY_DN24664_c0_g1_i1.p1  ORF type:complete len:590 (+),score=233.25 TRINITY_DN24664_c0_g1_i1:54-1772(+)